MKMRYSFYFSRHSVTKKLQYYQLFGYLTEVRITKIRITATFSYSSQRDVHIG